MQTAIQAGDPVQVHGEDRELDGADEPGPRRDAGLLADEGERHDPFESIGWAIYTLRVQGMPSKEIAAILGAIAPSRSVGTSSSTGSDWTSGLRLVRVPTLIVFATVQPVLFVLLFTYGFGGQFSYPASPTTSTTCSRVCSCSRSASGRPRPAWPSQRIWETG
jgi:hypothetical protein